MRCFAVTGRHYRCCYAAALLKSFDVARQIERLELPEVRALGPPKHRQQVSIVIITGLLDHPYTDFYQADTPAIRLGATPSGLTSAHLHHPPIFFTGRMPFLPPNRQCQSTEGN